MLISLERARQIYELMKDKFIKLNSGKLLIYVSLSVDSLASLRILISLLKSDLIVYEVIPVQSNDELRSRVEEQSPNLSSICGIIMINCVGENCISDLWICDEDLVQDLITIIIDSKRPISHKNMNHNNIIVFNDNMFNMEVPTEEEMEEVMKAGEEFDLDEEEDQSELKDSKKKRKIKRKGSEDLMNEGGNNEGGDDLDKELEKGTIQIGKKLDRVDITDEEEEIKSNGPGNGEDAKENELKQRIRELKIKQQKIHSYYSGSYYGFPAAYVLYKLATQFHKDDPKNLWYLIIAITDEYLNYHFSEKYYGDLHTFCQGEVLKIFQNKKKKLEGPSQGTFEPNSKDVKSIIVDNDYRLYLYRHWNLYDSFVYSNYPFGTLRTWREEGKNEVQKLFAYVGIPLVEAKQKYKYMKSEYKKVFKEKIVELSKIFELRDLLYNSFTYQFDQNTEMSAGDCTYLVSCLLNYPFDDIQDIEIVDDDIEERLEDITFKATNFTEDDKGRGNEEEGQNEEGLNPTDPNLIKKKARENLLKKFWLAYAFLSLKNLKMVNSLIDIAIKFQKAMFNITSIVIDRSSVTTSNAFRYSIINANVTEESKYFRLGDNLERLSIMIMETYKRTRGKKVENKPFLLAMLDADNNKYFIDGSLGCNRDYDDQKNEFGLKFKYIAKKTGMNINYDFLSQDIISIKKDDLFAFVQEMSAI
ncbi:MAG: cell division control 45 family protein [archaeon]|nr:cell division control 45 family protein [archaeon]